MPYLVSVAWVPESYEPMEKVPTSVIRNKKGNYIDLRTVKTGTPEGVRKYVDFIIEKSKKNPQYKDNFTDRYVAINESLKEK